MARNGRRKRRMVRRAVDMVNHPPHYNMGKIECIEAIDQVCETYPRGSVAASVSHVFTYLWRAPFKGSVLENLEKAQWWLNHAVELARKGG